ncbi:MAG: HAMP domain-containing histidine kinase [Acetobacter sp.]|nr:HAMP domain-containing histidine kinase [Bacteroides sp.]MCM1341024.1 HAMP domain-containing histidine kinase [Acetobacter sp.]MCM1432420.1 HAMP domain-containing histidine kinase [Clostridiales bacterium]
MKRFNYSMLKKIICVILCFITLIMATDKIVETFIGWYYFNDETDYTQVTDFTENITFQNYMYSDISNINSTFSEMKRHDDAEKSLKNVKDDVIQRAYDKAVQLLASAPKLEEYDENYEEVADYYYKNINIKAGNYAFTFNLNSLATNNDFEVNISNIKKQLSEIYDSFVDSTLYEVGYDYYPVSYDSSLKFYAENYGEKLSNTFLEEKPALSDIKSHDMYYIYENGKAEHKGISKTFADSIAKDIDKGLTLYLYFQFPEYKDDNIIDGIIQRAENYDNRYEGIRDLFVTAKESRENINKNCVLSVIYIVLSFVFGFLYLAVAGKKDRYEKAKLAFIDYLPVEFHLAITGGLGTGATMLMFTVADSIGISKYTNDVIVIYAAAIWMLAMELSSSIVRSFRSDRKWYKFFFTYWFVYGLIWFNKILFKCLGKLFSAMKKSSARTKGRLRATVHSIAYKPKTFKRNIILLSIAYLMINIILSIIGGLSISEDFYIFTILTAIVFIAFNAFVLYHVIRYISQLDRIIACSIEHKEYDSDLDKLYNSLRYLADSMKYTNTELQKAVAKAVKDERLRTELITNVSHDLKTPLTSIINYVDLLSKCDINDEKAQSYIKVLDEKGAKLKRLIDDLIEASKVTSGNVSVNLAPINLTELCLQATVDVQDDFDKAGLSLIIKSDETSNMIIADGPKTFRIVENLLSNARKYSAVSTRVYVSTYEEKGFGVFEIKNISAQPLDISADELTERFVRGDKSRNKEGNGLGLSIAKELTKLQNGELEITIDGDLFKARVKLPLRNN